MHQDITMCDAMMMPMRTTITLEPDVEGLVRKAIKERGASFNAI
jgi:hypothetical protein